MEDSNENHADNSFFSIIFFLSACDSEPESRLLNFDPPSLTACEPASQVTVKWDVRSAYPDVNVVQVFVIDGTSENLFAEGNALGDASTGPWARPEKPRFVLKDKANGKVLVEAVIRGPRC